MSRIGRKPIPVPAGVKIALQSGKIDVQGPKGKLSFAIPQGIQVAVEKQTHIVVSGADKGQVGQVAADMRSLRPPDPYKQKGVRITGERLKKKAGKAGAKAGGAAS